LQELVRIRPLTESSAQNELGVADAAEIAQVDDLGTAGSSEPAVALNERQLRRLVEDDVGPAEDPVAATVAEVMDASVEAPEPAEIGAARDRAQDQPALPLASPVGRRLKRAIDVVGSLALLGALSPVLAVCATAVRRSSPGPILFRQKRIGENGRAIVMLKFRTMYVDADQSVHQAYVKKLIAGEADARDSANGAVFKLVGDARVTPVGRWLRRLSLDELPQLINVLRGDMSLVGPRPPLPYEVEHYKPRALLRLRAKPGITGLWQVSGRSRTTFEEMIDLDLQYIERWSIRLDLSILFRTIPVVLFPDGH
jgi:exopolysaccharide biosynthesis polyprenyl glycosylphosphotransferase